MSVFPRGNFYFLPLTEKQAPKKKGPQGLRAAPFAFSQCEDELV